MKMPWKKQLCCTLLCLPSVISACGFHFTLTDNDPFYRTYYDKIDREIKVQAPSFINVGKNTAKQIEVSYQLPQQAQQCYLNISANQHFVFLSAQAFVLEKSQDSLNITVKVLNKEAQKMDLLVSCKDDFNEDITYQQKLLVTII